MMMDWQVRSSNDLVHRKLASTLYPDQTDFRDQPDFASAWETYVAEKPRKLEVSGARCPYTSTTGTPSDGKLTDDKPFLHKQGDLYYLSWGAF